MRASSPTATSPPPVSVVVLTLNEECNIADCLRSCAWCDDVHVLDSGSTDATGRIASEMGAAVHINSFQSFGQQRNFAIDRVPTRHPWQFHLDADERFTPELVAEIGRALSAAAPDQVGAYLVPSRMFFMGRWLRHGGLYPAYQARFVHRNRCRFIDYGHGQREQCDGLIARLTNPYDHITDSKGLVDWLHRHNRYSTREAQEAILTRREPLAAGQLLSADPLVRRRALKALSYRLRGRALWRFVHSYLAKRGFLDGLVGLRYNRLIAAYEGWTERKMREAAGGRPGRMAHQIARLIESARRTADQIIARRPPDCPPGGLFHRFITDLLIEEKRRRTPSTGETKNGTGAIKY